MQTRNKINAPKKKMGEGLDLFVFMGPFLIVFFTFTILPVFTSMIISLTDFNYVEIPQFVGFDNYMRLFLDDYYFTVGFQNTLILALISGPVGYILCFGFAWLINEVPAKPRAFLTLLFYAPSLAGGLAGIWGLLFGGDRYNYINAILLDLGIIEEAIQWTTDTSVMWPVAIIILLWGSLGTSFLTFIAGLQTVDRSLYEAAAVDGINNRWQELYFVTLPSMKGQLMFGAIMSITGAFNVGGTISTIFGNPTQGYTLYTIDMHLGDVQGTRYEMGYACAIAFILFVMQITVNKLIQYLLGKIGK